MLNIDDYITLELTSADNSRLLIALNHADIKLYNIQLITPLTVSFDIKKASFLQVSRITEKHGGTLHVRGNHGILNALYRISKRPVLLVALTIVIFLSLFLPTRVLFVEVEGAKTVEDRYIIENAAECGIYFGASRRNVRNEQVKNKLLSITPELHWAGVNTTGCVAVISVEERSSFDHQPDNSATIGNIVAAYDGVILACSVQNGTPLCHVGQAVKQGQVLVSGYTDCGFKLQATLAEAEITARTLRYLNGIVPSTWYLRQGESSVFRKISLLVGKKLINFSKCSGICGSTCVKMYRKKCLTLPGGRELPIALITETHTHYPQPENHAALNIDEDNMQRKMQAYLRTQMIAGEIDHAEITFDAIADLYLLNGTFSCSETISRKIYEVQIDHYG